MQTRNQKVFCRHVKRLFQKHSEDKQTYIEQDLQLDFQKNFQRAFKRTFNGLSKSIRETSQYCNLMLLVIVRFSTMQCSLSSTVFAHNDARQTVKHRCVPQGCLWHTWSGHVLTYMQRTKRKDFQSTLDRIFNNIFVSQLFGHSWPLLGRSWPPLGRSWRLLGRSWPLLGNSWPLLGRS